ncbi:MAG: preprotein translocase subunit SecE [Gammaproteobacteria bacterium]
MVLRTENQGEARLDWLKWVVAFVLLTAALVGNYYFSDIAMPLRTLAWLGVLVVAGFVASTTQKGKWVVGFFRDSRAELRKVVWPTREETMQTTMIVAVMVIILSLILWGMDGILVWAIGWMTGQRG